MCGRRWRWWRTDGNVGVDVGRAVERIEDGDVLAERGLDHDRVLVLFTAGSATRKRLGYSSSD